jgi:RNA polymerase sigma factor (sigma-70 family)
MTDPDRIERYWMLVQSTLRLFNESSSLVKDLRRSIEQLDPAQQTLFFHSEPFDVARDLAGRSDWSQQLLTAYATIVDEARQAPSLGATDLTNETRPAARIPKSEKPRAAADRALATLRDPARTGLEKERAFEVLLAVPEGWWGKLQLLTFALAVALKETRAILGHAKADRIDWERIAGEGLFELFQSARKIEGNPRNWLWGVIKNLVRQEMKKRGPELTAALVGEWQPAREAEDEDTVRARSLRDEEHEQRLQEAVSTLTPVLRDVAQLHYVERCTNKEIEERLQLSPSAVRKNLQRIREHFEKLTQAKDPPGAPDTKP